MNLKQHSFFFPCFVITAFGFEPFENLSYRVAKSSPSILCETAISIVAYGAISTHRVLRNPFSQRATFACRMVRSLLSRHAKPYIIKCDIYIVRKERKDPHRNGAMLPPRIRSHAIPPPPLYRPCTRTVC